MLKSASHTVYLNHQKTVRDAFLLREQRVVALESDGELV
jgi:hypothetical protein